MEEKIKDHFGIRLSNIDVTDFTEKDRPYLVELLIKYKVIAITNHRKIDYNEAVKFCELLGIVWTNTGDGFLVGNNEEGSKHPETNKITLVSNIPNIGVLGSKEVNWHQDLSHRPWNSPGGAMPTRMLYCDKSAPDEISTTQWLDTTYIYDNCPNSLRNRLENRNVVRKAPYPSGWEPNIMPMVIVNPNTGKKGICFDPVFNIGLEGIDPDEAKSIFKQLYDIATKEENVITHKWKENDMVIGDNYFTCHKRLKMYSTNERRLWRLTFQIPELIPKEIYPPSLEEVN